MEIDNEPLLKSFVAETGEGLTQMEQALLELESHPDDAELVNTVFRVVHTFKGNAAIFELNYALEFAHVLEDLLDRLRANQLSCSAEIADILLSSQDVLRELTAGAAAGKDEATPLSRKLLQRIKGQLETDPAGKKDAQSRTAPEKVNVEPAMGPAAHATPLSPVPAVRTLRVDVQKLDRLLDLTGEIAIAQGQTTRLLENPDRFSIEELAEAHNTEAMLQTELHELVMKVRMVPVGPLFRQYQRTVRDLAKELGKTVNLHLEGDEVEVDTSVVEHLRDPLLHMIRNAMDHGIEVPEQRRKAGKPPAGTITLRASHQSGNISIEVEDDGAGLDRAKVLDAARKRGIFLDPGLSDHDIHQLVFESGLSTTDQVSNLSGRGVGMDVVRRNVQALRGNVSISSRLGLGSTVHLRFPLTLAIIDGFLVGIGNETYVIPVDWVIECVELPEEQNDLSRKEGVLQLRDSALPFLYLKDHFGLPGERSGRQNIVVVQHEDSRVGLAVDAQYGTTQTVIKPLPTVFKNVPGISGSAILGSGRVAMILDIPALLRDFCTQGAG